MAQSGRIGIYGNLVNQRGLVSADRAAVGANGQIVFKASGDLLLEAGSLTSASGAGTGTGGTIHLLGERVGLTGNAHVDASGESGGGTVLVGGDLRGQNPAIANAKQVYVSRDATIDADALASGNGGKVIAWSDGTTRVHGSISARGGAQSGDGGFVETSGHTLDMRGRVDTRAPNGRTGTLLLDPTNIFIANDLASAAAAGMVGSDTSAQTFVASGAVSDSLSGTSHPAGSAGQQHGGRHHQQRVGHGRRLHPRGRPRDLDQRHELDAQCRRGHQHQRGDHRRTRQPARAGTGWGATSTRRHPSRGDAVGPRGYELVDITNAMNQVQRLAGFANGAGGFNFRNNSMSLTIGVAGPENGITSLGNGPVNINAGGNLMLLSPVRASQAGDIVLASAGTLDNQSTVSSTSGRVTVQGSVLQPSLADCIANPAPAGCTAVLPTLSACQSDPAIAGSVVLPPPVASPPTLATCIAAPSTSGCAAVLPTLAQCISAPTSAGCSVVLPTSLNASARPRSRVARSCCRR